jgi:hypothetical protein
VLGHGESHRATKPAIAPIMIAHIICITFHPNRKLASCYHREDLAKEVDSPGNDSYSILYHSGPRFDRPPAIFTS